MEPDDLLCSRNARFQKALVGRAQWKINQPPSLENQRASLEGSIRWVMLVRCAYRGSTTPPWFKIGGGDRPLIGLFPFGTNEGIESLSKKPLRLPIPFSVLYELKNVLGSIDCTLRQ